jgi:hypothetical protein
MNAESAKIESGQVFLRLKAPWLEELRLELLQFPYGRHDDQADSISQFLNWIWQRNRNRAILLPLSALILLVETIDISSWTYHSNGPSSNRCSGSNEGQDGTSGCASVGQSQLRPDASGEE